MTEVYQSERMLEDGLDALITLRDQNMAAYHRPGESGRGLFCVHLTRHRFSSASTGENGDTASSIDPEESPYFHRMDRIESGRMTRAVMEETGTVPAIQQQSVGDYLPSRLPDEEGGGREGYRRLSMDDPLLFTPVTVQTPEEVEQYTILDAIDVDYDGALLVDRTGEIYPWTVEVVPPDTFPERYREGWGMKHRSALNISAAELGEPADRELPYVREFQQRRPENVDSVVDGQVVEQFLDGWGDVVSFVLSSETGQISAFDKGYRLTTTRPIAAPSEGMVDRLASQEDSYEPSEAPDQDRETVLEPVQAASD